MRDGQKDKPLRIDVWSDIACPWCWVGKRHLDRAVAAAAVRVELRWRAFELDPAAPRVAPSTVDYAARLAAKYATSRSEAEAMIERMVEHGRGAGVVMRFDRIRPASTFDAHRLLAWAAGEGEPDDLVERLFTAYLGEGRAISDRATLAELAEEAGLDGARAAEILASDDFADRVRADEREAAALGIRSVPTFVLDRRLVVSGAHPPTVLRQAIEAAVRVGEPEDEGAAPARER